MNKSTVKPRCYAEYCCNTATHHVETIDRSGRGREPIGWGWCTQHHADPKWHLCEIGAK